MLSPFIVNDKNVFIERFPPAQVNRSLQAWDATDEYFINHLNEQNLLECSDNILLFNDSFGALALALAGKKVTSVSDSYLSQQGTIYNAEQNNLTDGTLTLVDSLADIPTHCQLILYRIPKSKALLTYQLSQIALTYGKNTKVTFIAGAKAKDIHSSTLKVFEQYLGTTTTSLAVKKSRLVFCQLNQAHVPQKTSIKQWKLDNSDYLICNHANVFSRDSLDIGARFFIDNLPNIAANQYVVDLGCGNGIVGLSVLARQPQANMLFKDESFMAVDSARQTITHNLPEQLSHCQFSADDCLSQCEANSADIILCNPPFHQQHATTDHIAWQMFKDSKRVLKKGGELRIIGNRQLGYHVKLKRIFGNCRTIASNKKFVVLSSINQ